MAEPSCYQVFNPARICQFNESIKLDGWGVGKLKYLIEIGTYVVIGYEEVFDALLVARPKDVKQELTS